jgi:hypothetical protein
MLDEESAKPIYFLLAGEKVHAVSVGDTIDNTYRVDAVQGTLLTLVYLPLDQKQTLAVGAASTAAPAERAVSGIFAPGGGDVTLNWQAPAELRLDKESRIALIAKASKPVSTITIALSYDKDTVSVLRVEPGPMLGKGGTPPGFVPKIEAATGKLTVRVDSREQAGQVGEGELLALVVQGRVPAPSAKLEPFLITAIGPTRIPMPTSGLPPLEFPIKP